MGEFWAYALLGCFGIPAAWLSVRLNQDAQSAGPHGLLSVFDLGAGVAIGVLFVGMGVACSWALARDAIAWISTVTRADLVFASCLVVFVTSYLAFSVGVGMMLRARLMDTGTDGGA